MTLQEQLEEAARTSLRAGDSVRTSTIRMALSEVHNRRIELGRPPDDAEVVQVLARQVKQRRESIEQFRAAGRDELAGREEAELAVLSEFLPEQIDEQELERMARDAIVEVGATSTAEAGRVMSVLAPRIRGRADGRTAADLVKRLLAGDPLAPGPGPAGMARDS